MKDTKNKVHIANIAAFLVLMQNNGGLISKHPNYVMEYFRRYCLSDREDEFLWGLDSENKRKLLKWLHLWHLGKEANVLTNYLEEERQELLRQLNQAWGNATPLINITK